MPPSCIQLRSRKMSSVEEMLLKLRTPESEDCLYLNVHVPRVRHAGRFPVLVFIHGGGFSTGSTSAPLYDPSDLMASWQDIQRPAIVVAMNYRLGLFGYLASSRLSTNPISEADEGSGNYGLQDQMLALQWIRQKIQAFHGDPSNVTVLGHSAGAMSASWIQLLRPQLADQWVLMSGTALTWHERRVDGPVEHEEWAKLLDGANCTDVDCMRAADAAKLTAIAISYQMDYVWGPTVDSVLIHKPARLLIGENRAGPTVITTVRDEGSLFIRMRVMQWSDLHVLLNAYFDRHVADQVLLHYPTDQYASPFQAANAIITDAIFTCPAIKYYSQMNPQANHFAQFNTPMLLPSMASLLSEGKDYGVFHGSDMVILFNFNPFITVFNDSILRDLRNGLAEFMVTGSPLDGKRWPFVRIWESLPAAFYRGQCQSVWFDDRPKIPRTFESLL